VNKNGEVGVERKKLFLACALILQTVVCGLLLMSLASVSSELLLLQAGVAILLAPIALVVSIVACRMSRTAVTMFLLLIAVAVLFVGFCGCDIDGMRRWICVGPLRLHVPAVLVSPFLVSFCNFRRDNEAARENRLMFIAATVVILAVAWASDLSYAAALVAGLVVGAVARSQKLEALYWICFGVVALFLAVARDVDIPPVLHTEGILSVAFAHSRSLGVIALLSLFLACASPLIFWRRTLPLWQQSSVLSLFALFVVLAGFGLTQKWPVVFMGFGSGPILGAALAIGILSGVRHDDTHS
jgi:hypothetical protein